MSEQLVEISYVIQIWENAKWHDSNMIYSDIDLARECLKSLLESAIHHVRIAEKKTRVITTYVVVE